MGGHEDGGASQAPLLHCPVLVTTATRPPGSLSRGQWRAMSCCRWCSGCMHTKRCAWGSWKLCANPRDAGLRAQFDQAQHEVVVMMAELRALEALWGFRARSPAPPAPPAP
jgi:hypothetical protein